MRASILTRTLAAAGVLTVLSVTAFAGKAERDMMTKEVQPEAQRAESAFKTSCGCPLAVKIDEATLTTVNDLREGKHIAGHVADGATAYCTDAASKKAVCQMKTLVIGKAKEATFSFKGGTGTATTDGQSNTTWDMMTRELDK